MDYANLAISVIVAIAALIAGRYIWPKRDTSYDDMTIKHIDIQATDAWKQWHREAIAKAAAKYGRAFKDGPLDLPHEQAHRQEPRSRDLQEIDAASKREREGKRLEKMIEDNTNLPALANGRRVR